MIEMKTKLCFFFLLFRIPLYKTNRVRHTLSEQGLTAKHYTKYLTPSNGTVRIIDYMDVSVKQCDRLTETKKAFCNSR